MDSATSSLSLLEPELYFLIARFLSSGPCKRAFAAILEELEEFKLLPQRVDWEGNEHFRSYENLVYLNRHIRPDHLLRIVERVGALLDKEIKPSVAGVKSLLGAGSLSLLRTTEDIKKTKWSPSHHLVRQNGVPMCPPANLAVPAVPHVLKAYEMCGVVRHHSVVPVTIYNKIGMHGRKLGHLSAVYCVLFDRTGSHIFTGADDGLVKIWSTYDMRLLATLRGHSAEITDMAVSFENTYLASGSCDKIVRVWNLRSKAPAAVLQAHSSMITSVQFCPKPQGETRYLVSTGNDGCVCFWHFNIHTNVFSLKPVKFIERSRAGAQMLCSSFSPGGAFLATGNSDHVVRVYFLHALGIEKICELEAHTDKVDSICYSNCLNRFVSGSNDGTARIWRYEKQEWRATVLNMNAKLNSYSAQLDTSRSDAREPVRVTMVSWSTDDAMVMTAASDLTIKIWNAYTGTLSRVLEGHEDDVFVLEACPTDARILLSAGHDGKMIIWDVYTGAKIKKFFNLIEGQGHGAVFDCKFSPDGYSVAATDSHGHLLLMGFGTNEKCKKVPQQVFFHTDYRPLMRDANNFVLDEQTQQPPHLMPPPFLVDIDGNPYPASMQRLVPGRENCSDTNLVPQMIVNAHGESEVVGDIDNEVRGFGAANQVEESETEEDDDGARPGALGRPGGVARPSIDVMIEELQRQQDQRLRLEPGGSNGQVMSPPPLASPPTPRSNMQNRIGMRRSGEIEGVRQSLGNVSVQSTKKERDAMRRHVTVRPLDPEALRASEEKRLAYAEEEIKKFMTERKKKLLSPHETSTASVLINQKRGQKPKKQAGNRGLDDTPENVETARNRLTTRALYDTEEEEEEEDAGSDLDLWNSDNTSDDYSDWVGDQEGNSNLEPPKRRSQRKQVRRQLSSSDDDDLNELDDDDDDNDDDDDDEEEETESTTSEDSSEEEKEETIADGPVISSRRESRHKQSNQRPRQKKQRKVERRKKARHLPPDPGVNKPVKELDEKMKPPEWITTVIPRKAPFVPQMGDEVIYFRQGHEQYVQAVERKKVYPVDLDRNQPWHKIPNLRAHEVVKIVGIKWLIKPTRLCCLKMAFMDNTSGKLTGKSFTIKYHDMPDVIDFIVLKQHFDISVERGWRPGSKFRSMIDDQWWIGVIKSQEPLNPDFPDSLYQCFNVLWDNGEFEKLSPWDMEPVDPKRKPSDVGGGVDVTPDEYKALLYVPKKTEWPSCGREAESQRLIRCLEALMQHSLAEPFIAPVDLQQFPTYACFVSYPIDFSTIKTRLENGFYRRITALQWDARMIYTNASIFNRSGTVIVKNANALSETLLRFIKDHACQDPLPILSELAHSDLKIGSSDEDSQQGSSSIKGKKQSSSRRKQRKSKANPDAWLQQCESLLATLFECEDSEPFRLPVDPALYPDYEEIVKYPMDLTTAHTKLATGHYGNPVDLSRDIRLIFQNSKQYNTNKRSRIYSMTLRLSALFEVQMAEIIKQWKSALKASGRIKQLPRSKRSSSPQPFSSWDTLTNSILDPGQPSTSGQIQSHNRMLGRDDGSSLFGSSSIVSSSHPAGSSLTSASFSKTTGAADGDDSDATILENDKADDDDEGDTEFCDEETGINGHIVDNLDRDDVDDSDDEDYEDDKDNDYKPSSKYRSKSQRGTVSKGKSSKRGKIKSSRLLPVRTSSGRLKKSNIFYTSDSFNDIDDLTNSDNEEENDRVPSRSGRSRGSNKIHDDSSENEVDKTVKTSKKGGQCKSGSIRKGPGRPRKTRNHSFKKFASDSEESPIHRKARGTRSKKQMFHSEEEDDAEEIISSKKNPSALSRSARSARSQRKYYNEDDSDVTDDDNDEDADLEDADDNEENSESEEESSSDEAEEDSEDELITRSLRSVPEKPSKSKGQKRRKGRDDNGDEKDSDSDSAVPPRKRTRMRKSPTSVKSLRKANQVKSVPLTKSNRKSKRGSKESSTRQTRNRGQQKVTYLEDYSDEEDNLEEDDDDEDDNGDKADDTDSDDLAVSSVRSVSSRGRVRKLTARAKANLKRQKGTNGVLAVGK